MKDQAEIIHQEETRFETIKQQINLTFQEEKVDRDKLGKQISDLKADKLNAESWREKKELDDRIYEACQESERRMFQEKDVLRRNPYFGVLEIEDDQLGNQSYCLGKRTFFNRQSKALVIDWREAPISQLFYEYESGEEYEEDIRDKERSGIIRCKRKVNTSNMRLTEIADGDLSLIKNPDGEWQTLDPGNISKQRQETAADHHLQEITAFISAEQFRSITQPEAGIVVLEGGAGSGKTTVGLHRVSYLLYQEPRRYGAGSILVVMYNRSLQKYISKALTDLDIGQQAIVETYHGWATSLFRKNGSRISYSTDFSPSEVVAFKKSAQLLGVLEAYIQRLHHHSVNWLLEKLTGQNSSALETLKSRIAATPDLKALCHLVFSNTFLINNENTPFLEDLQRAITNRLDNHFLDLYQVITDRELIEGILQKSGTKLATDSVNRLIQWENRLKAEGKIDFNDPAILIWLMQAKGFMESYDHFEHIMVDEAQDLSPVEITTLVNACKKGKSMTICGDMAQKIKGDFAFEGAGGFSGFLDRLISRQDRAATGKRSNRLSVGYRATRQIMELAWQVLGQKGKMETPKDGPPVAFYQTADFKASVEQTIGVLQEYRKSKPNALVGVICRKKEQADSVFHELEQRGVGQVRRHQRDDFTFTPGVIVTNAHQVKGLEFSAVVIFNPSKSDYIETTENRMLLHVVITRATERVWVIGHEPMAFGIGNSSGQGN